MLVIICSTSRLLAFPVFSNDTIVVDSTSFYTIDTLTRSLNDTISLDTLMASLKKEPAIKSKIRYSAKDSIVYDITGTQVYLYRGAEVYYEDIILKADYIRIDQQKKIVYAEGVKDSTGKVVGKPVFEDAGQIYNSDYIAYNFETKKGKIREVTTQEGEGYLLANDVKKNEYDEIFIRNGKYTTCNLPHPHYYIALTKAKNTENKTVSGPAYLVVEDVPLPLAIPFGFFPRQSGRSSGVLLPEIGEDAQLGFFLRNGGYYFGFSEYVDLALRGDIYSRGSYGFNMLSRYHVRYRFNGSLAAGYNDRRFGEPETFSFSKTQDFYVRWNHNQDGKARPGTRFSANVNVASRNNYRNQRTPSISSIVQNDLSSSVSYSKNWVGTPFSLSGALAHNQNLQTGRVHLGLPRVSFNVARINPFDSKSRIGEQHWYHRIGLNYTMDAENKIDTYDSVLFKQETLSKFQNGIRHSIPVSTSFNVLKFLVLSPNLNYTERWYFSSVEKAWDGTQVITDTLSGFKTARDYSMGLNTNTRIYGMFNINRAGIVALRHVATPTLGFSYRPDFGEPAFGYYKNVQLDSAGTMGKYSIFENGIYGSPGMGKSSLLSFSLDNNFEMKVKTENDTASSTKKITLIQSLRLGASYNMAVDSMNLSMISINARTVLFNKLNLDFNAVYDPYILRMDSLGVARRLNQYEWNVNKRPGRLTSAGFAVSTNLNADAFKSKNKQENELRRKYSRMEMDYVTQHPEYYIDWTIPWSLAINYNLTYSRPMYTAVITQSLNFSGDLSVTPKWKIGFTSGYDFTMKEITPTALNIYRDLHCWDLAINWIPFGTYQRYSVDLKVKASILQDLKLSKRREYYERD